MKVAFKNERIWLIEITIFYASESQIVDHQLDITFKSTLIKFDFSLHYASYVKYIY